MLIKPTLVSLLVMSLCSATFALVPNHPPKKQIYKPGEKIKAKTESPYALAAPGTRLVEGEENQNEFYILGKNDPDPVKPKPKTQPAVAEVKKTWVYKVEVHKVAVKKPQEKQAKVYVEKNKVQQVGQ